MLTADDYDEALRFYRYVLGLPQLESYTHDGRHVAILDARWSAVAFMPCRG